MGKEQAPLFAELDAGATAEKCEINAAAKFVGTENPRYLRVLQALELRARSREEIDKIAGASNGPQLIANLRGLGLTIPCRLVPGIDRDGNPIRFGVYSLGASDCKKIRLWQRQRERNAHRATHEK